MCITGLFGRDGVTLLREYCAVFQVFLISDCISSVPLLLAPALVL